MSKVKKVSADGILEGDWLMLCKEIAVAARVAVQEIDFSDLPFVSGNITGQLMGKALVKVKKVTLARCDLNNQWKGIFREIARE